MRSKSITNNATDNEDEPKKMRFGLNEMRFTGGTGILWIGGKVILIDRFASDTAVSTLQIYQIPLSSKSPVLSPTEFYK